ncbi:hypothetical protein [Klebsiella aerogenes]|uniref:hypothetical protein n=1 Tax=Klebsiella aerogenes TaxID=548 RepID=UPI0034D346CB
MKGLFFILFLIPTLSFAQSINKTKDEVISSLSAYADTLKSPDLKQIKELLKNPNFTPGDEWGDAPEDTPRYSLKIDNNLVFKMDIDASKGKVFTLWLQYPRENEYASNVIAMKKAIAYVTNIKIYTDKKLNKQYTKFMNTPRDSKGKANYKRIYGYAFMNTICSDEIFCITAEDD